MFRKNKRKIFVFFLVAAIALSVIKPQIMDLVFAEEQDNTEVFVESEISTPCDATETGTYESAADIGTPCDAVEETVEVDATVETDAEEYDDEAKTISVYVPESGCRITINAPEGSLPYPVNELSVEARELKQDSVEYSAYMMATVNALNQDSSDDIAFVRFFDIEILKDGEKVEPIAPVEVKIEYDDAPGITDAGELSIVHFADEGIEVIKDIELNDDATEIVYDQGSFSITATVVIAVAEPEIGLDKGHDYVLVATCDDKVYTVQNDGSLRELSSSNYKKTGGVVSEVTEDASFMWKYTKLDNNKTYLRYVSDGYDYNADKLAQEFAYTTITPDVDEGLITSTPSHNDDENKTVKREGGNVIYDNYPVNYPIIFAGNEIRSEAGKYLTISADKKTIQGNATNPDDGVKFYFAKAVLPDETDLSAYSAKPNNHIVNHIDISISDTLQVDIPLAYGNYYDKDGNIVLTVDREHYPDGYNLRVTQKVSVSQEQLRKAKITANKRLEDAEGNAVPGDELNNAFYITGYSANAETSLSTPQVRIEGIFKVADTAPGNNSDAGVKAARLEHRILYTVEAVEPNARFYYINPNKPEEHLYDADGNELYIDADVTIKDSFDFFDPRNECPPLHGTKYSPYAGEDFEDYWKAGQIHNWGISGMDFKLSGEATVDIRPYAIEIENKIMDTDGNPIIPRDKITGFKFGVYVNPTGNPDSAVGKNVGAYTGDDFDLSAYGKVKDKTIDIDNDPDKNAANVVYEYSLPEGMVYIDEDKNTVPEIITDKDGNRWVYKKTYIETEYVWRESDSNNYKRHFSKDYNVSDSEFNSVPEVVGTYGTEFNKFLEFYVRNVYEKIEPPSKREIDPYVGNGELGGVNVGSKITYEIAYSNYKNRAADVVITDKLDKNAEFVSASDGGVYNADTHTVIWTLKDVASGEKGTVTLKVKVLEGALEKNGGSGVIVNGGDTSTVKVGNDDEFTLDTVKNPVPDAPAKKEISPYEGSGTLGAVKVNDEITYEITYKNYMDAAADVIITDKLDPNVQFISATDGGVYNSTSHTVVWTIKNLPSDKEGKVILKVKVLESALESKGGSGEVENGGTTSTVKVGNDVAYSLELVKNPVTETGTSTEDKKSNTPTSITTTTDKSTPTTTTKSVKTGDNAPIGLILMMDGLSVMFIIALCMVSKRKKKY